MSDRTKWDKFSTKEIRALKAAIEAARGERESGSVEKQLHGELKSVLRVRDSRSQRPRFQGEMNGTD